MKEKIVIILSMLCIFFSGCVRDVTTEREFESATPSPTIESESQTEEYDCITIEKSDIQSEYTYSTVDIEIPEYATLTSYCVYNNLVYYSYNYLDYIYQGGVDEITDTYNNQICVYDIESKTSEVIYTVPVDTEYITHIGCNGEQLLFVQDVFMGMESNPKIFLMDLSQDVLKAVSVPLDMFVSSVELIDNYIIWIAQSSDLKSNSIYRYDYTTGDTVELINNVYAYKFEINYIEKIITICNEQKDGSINIKAYGLDGNIINSYKINTYVTAAKCNSKWVVWLQNQMLFYYDFASDKVHGLLGYATDFELIDDRIISVGYSGVYSYKLDDVSQKYIFKSEEGYRADFKNNTAGEIYAKWYISGQYGVPWDEDVVTILQIH